MRQLRNLLVGVLLAGFASGALAASYSVSFPVLATVFSVGDTSCTTVGEKLASFMTAYWTAGGSSTSYFFYGGECSGALRVAGDTMSIALTRVTVAGPSASGPYSLVLAGVAEDDVLGDVGSVAVQRVLVLVGCVVMFGLGWIGGKA